MTRLERIDQNSNGEYALTSEEVNYFNQNSVVLQKGFKQKGTEAVLRKTKRQEFFLFHHRKCTVLFAGMSQHAVD